MPSFRLARIDILRCGIPAALAATVTILALHAALLPEAHWQGDDFICAAFARDGRLRYLWEARIDGWSPRPLSELLFYAFGRLAAASQRPFTIPFLALLWSLFVASTLLTMRRGRSPSLRILIGLATVCMALLGHPIAEMFFWPAGAVAYLSTLAATSLVLFLLADGRTGSLSGAMALSASLTACAASSESGAVAAALLTFILTLVLPFGKRRVVFLPPLLTSGFVFWMLAHHRLVSPEAVSQASPLRHLMQSLRPVPGALLDDLRPVWPARLCFILGLRWCWTLRAQPVPAPRALAFFAGALVLAAALVIAAGFFQLGMVCCERHDSLRQGWAILALAAIAIGSVRWPARPGLARLGPAMLCVACLVGLAPGLGAITGDFRLMHAITAVNKADWRAGRNPASRSMIFRLPPPAAIAGAVGVPPGHYSEPAEDSWTAHGIMHFFGKSSITIEPP